MLMIADDIKETESTHGVTWQKKFTYYFIILRVVLIFGNYLISLCFKLDKDVRLLITRQSL